MLTDSQIRDLMLMRQLYLTKRGILAMERKALANQMARSPDACFLTCVRSVQLTSLCHLFTAEPVGADSQPSKKPAADVLNFPHQARHSSNGA